VAEANPRGERKATVSHDDPGVVEQTLRINASPETVWAYWTDPERMCAWWAAAAELDPRPGGICRVDSKSGGIMQGEFVELVPFERLVFTFGWEPAEGAPAVPPRSTRVEVRFVADAGDTIMTLRHSGIPASEAGRHHEGWDYFLPLLVEAASA
jgi:uncharacterized protein YndB with AHSA1/START domain